MGKFTTHHHRAPPLQLAADTLGNRHYSRWSLSATLLLAACGGGGSGGPDTASALTAASPGTMTQSGSSAPSASSTPSASSAPSGASATPVAPAVPANRHQSSLSVAVHGNTLVDTTGRIVQLRGVNVSGLEFVAIDGFSPANPWGGQTGDATPNWNTIKTWGVNTVRLPLNEASWLGYACVDSGGTRGTVGATLNPDPGANYQATVASAVAAATSAGLYVILDLHWSAPANNCPMSQNPMADSAHSLDFWRQIASTFKAYPNVIFEPFNEPYLYWLTSSESPWPVLLGGGTETQFVTGGNPYQAPLTWATAGMQQIVDTIRASGARNVVLVAGVSWAQDLSQWLAHRPNDPLGQLGAVWHAYPTFGTSPGSAAYAQPNNAPGVWGDVQGILAAGFPVVITEYGDHNAAGSLGAPFASNLLPWADLNGVSYLGWAWDLWQSTDNVLISDAAGTPSAGYGVYVRQHYLCRAAGTAACS